MSYMNTLEQQIESCMHIKEEVKGGILHVSVVLLACLNSSSFIGNNVHCSMQDQRLFRSNAQHHDEHQIKHACTAHPDRLCIITAVCSETDEP